MILHAPIPIPLIYEKTKQISLTAICSAAVIFNLSACKYEDWPAFSLRTKDGRLIGKWEAQKFDGEIPPDDEINKIEIVVEFEKDGDLVTEISYFYSYNYNGQTYSYDYSYKYLGSWDWSKGKEELEINLDVDYDGDEFDAEVLRLTNEELSFTDENGDKYEFTKIKD